MHNNGMHKFLFEFKNMWFFTKCR